VSLDFLAKYIRNKQVNGNMINDLADFDGMGDAIWNFISSVYDAKWDALYTDNNVNTLRAKVSLKFTPRTIPQHNGNKKDIAKSVPVTINKVPPPPLFWLKPERKLISSPNTSIPRNRQLKTLPKVTTPVLENHMHKSLSLQSAHQTC